MGTVAGESMKILGLDFTSAPNRRKSITCAVGRYSDGKLHISDFQRLTQFEQFEELLTQPGPWCAGIDFPFGQPAKLIQNLDWGVTWESYVQIVAGMTIKEFEDTLKRYRDRRPKGD